MTTHWRCLACEEEGESDRAAERHTRATKHATVTSTKGKGK